MKTGISKAAVLTITLCVVFSCGGSITNNDAIDDHFSEDSIEGYDTLGEILSDPSDLPSEEGDTDDRDSSDDREIDYNEDESIEDIYTDTDEEFEEFIFPHHGDTHNIEYDPYMYLANDNINGIRYVSTGPFTQADISIQFRSNTLAAGVVANIEININGNTIGIISVTGDDINIVESYIIDSVYGPNVEISITLLNSITLGEGAIWIEEDISVWTLYM